MNRTRVRAWVGTIVFLFLAPGIVAGLIPYAITQYRIPWQPPALVPVAIVAGLALLAGVVVLLDAFVRFARADGTPAPPVPTAHLVVVGPYRFVRNPMYLGVLAIILGQALLFGSSGVLIYAVVAFGTVLLFVKTYEEPTLLATYGDEYREYTRNVRGWWPRVTPWRGTGSRSSGPILPAAGLLVPESVLRQGGLDAKDIWSVLETTAAPVAIDYHPVTDVEVSRYRTVKVNTSLQQALVEVVKAVNPKNPTLLTVVIPKGSELVRAVGADGFRGFTRNAGGIAAHAVLKPVAVGGAALAGWPVFAVAGTVLVLDMAAQRELRAHQRRIETLLGRHEERYFIDRMAEQHSTDELLSRAIGLLLDGGRPPLDLAVKSANAEFHRAEQFLAKYRPLLRELADTDKVDFRKLERALGGQTKDVGHFIRELHLTRAAIALKRKALIADAASAALADPANPYSALRSFLEQQAQKLEHVDKTVTELTERLTGIEMKGRWYDVVTGLWYGPDKSVAGRRRRLREELAPFDDATDPELQFIATSGGEIMQVVAIDEDDDLKSHLSESN